MDSSSKEDCRYDVYLSCGGEDIRRTFTGHLYCSLKHHRFNVFMYDYKLEKSNGGIPERLIQEIERSKVAVVVFSSGYLMSEWCLEELVKIMECGKRLGLMFFPILYDVDPLDVRNQVGSFMQKFQKVKGEKMLHWIDALYEAVSLAELNLRKTDGHEGSFIRNVIAQIAQKLSCTTCSEVATSLVGIDSRVREISKHLDVGGSNDVRIIGILGMCGLGKTTVAQAVFDKHHHSFDGASFLQNVREKKLVDLQEQLLSDILKPAYIVISSMDEGTEEIEQMLRKRSVLVVIDGVDSVEQLDTLAIKPDSFGLGSRIIITSRNEHLLKILDVDKICTLPAMNERRALELLSWHAFGKNYPNEEYVELSRKAVGYCGGLPLALEVLGSCLHTKSRSEWKTELDKWKRLQPYFTFNGMDYSIEKYPRRKLQLKGPRPTPLNINKDSVKIKKPPVVRSSPRRSYAQDYSLISPSPVVIYSVSPKVIRSSPSGLMDLVQSLTGLPPSNYSTTSSSLPSNINPPNYDNFNKPPAHDQGINKSSTARDVVEGMEIMDDGGDGCVRQKGVFRGILSPGPASITPIPSNFFSQPGPAWITPTPSNFFSPPAGVIPLETKTGVIPLETKNEDYVEHSGKAVGYRGGEGKSMRFMWDF